ATLPRLAVAADLASGDLKRLPGRSSVRAISAIRRRDQGGPALEEFWQLLAGHLLPARIYLVDVIETRGLRRVFKSRKRSVEAVVGVDLNVHPGEIFGFLGPNGAGK